MFFKNITNNPCYLTKSSAGSQLFHASLWGNGWKLPLYLIVLPTGGRLPLPGHLRARLPSKRDSKLLSPLYSSLVGGWIDSFWHTEWIGVPWPYRITGVDYAVYQSPRLNTLKLGGKGNGDPRIHSPSFSIPDIYFVWFFFLGALCQHMF